MSKRLSVHDRFKRLRKHRIEEVGEPIPESFQGVSKERIKVVLSKVDLDSRDVIDCVFALLDDETESFRHFHFSDGASTAHLGCHIAFLQRDNDIKLDREGRDIWIKPLREIGAVEMVTLNKGAFIAGHVISKSPNSSYKLDQEFVRILKSPEQIWESQLTNWISKDTTRRRLEMQAKAAEESRKLVDIGHKQLIQATVKFYAPKFLPGFKVVYVDDSDGDRISKDERNALKEAGIALELTDAFPDVLLWNSKTDELWCIEAVTSDGEVDFHKVQQLQRLVKRHGKKGVGFTTAYRTWKAAASRQDANRNLAIGSYLWISSDPSRQFEVKSYEGEVAVPKNQF